VENKSQNKIISDLRRRKASSHEYLRSLTPTEKIAMLFNLQEQYYQMLVARENNGGKPIPEKWRKWHKARSESVR
jgi:hypothetical protein